MKLVPFSKLIDPVRSVVLSILLVLGLWTGPGYQASGAEAAVEAVLRAMSTGDEDRIYEAAEAHHDAESWAGEAEKWRGLAKRLSRFGGLEISSLDSDGTIWSAYGQTPDGEGVGLRFETRGPHLADVGVRLGARGPESSLPAIELPPGASEADLTVALGDWLDGLEDFSGTALVARDGKTIFTRAAGLADRRWRIANTPKTRFDVGSINKIFTKVAVARQLEKGRLRLEDTIADHLPDYPDGEVAAKVTIAQLLDHSSGLGDIFNPRYRATPKDQLRRPRDFFPLFAGEPLLFEPGTGRSYSNAGYQVLGAVLEAVTGEDYHRYMEKAVFEPAGMSSSGFFATDEPHPDIAVGYSEQGGAVRSNLFLLPVIGSPAGSSMCTAGDLLRFDRALREHRLVSPAYSRWVLGGATPGPEQTAGDELVRTAIGVAGGAPGVSAVLESDGEWTVVVLSNADEPGAEQVGSALLRAVRSGG